MTQQATDSKQLISNSLIAIAILIAIFGLIYWFNKPVGGFNSNDQEVQAVIQAIIQFEQDKGQPPENLEELIPNYIESLDMPENIFGLMYETQPETGTWQLTFDTGCGFLETFSSDGFWRSRWPSAEDAVECYQN